MSKDLRVNNQINVTPIRLIDDEGTQVGVIELADALKMAREKGLDLVEVSPKAELPVCKIQDYGKYKYHQSKVDHRQRQKQKGNELKEIRLSPRIGDHDMDVKIRKAGKFLEAGDRVKINLMFRGREIQHVDIGKEKIEMFAEKLKDVSSIETPLKRQNKCLFLVLQPITSVNAKSQDA